MAIMVNFRKQINNVLIEGAQYGQERENSEIPEDKGIIGANLKGHFVRVKHFQILKMQYEIFICIFYSLYVLYK